MSSLERHGKYGYSYRDSYKRSFGHDRVVNHERDRGRRDVKSKRSRSKDRYASNDFPSLDSSKTVPVNSRDSRSKNDSYRSMAKDDLVYNYNPSFEPPSIDFRDNKPSFEYFNEGPNDNYRRSSDAPFEPYRRENLTPSNIYKVGAERSFDPSGPPQIYPDVYPSYRREFDTNVIQESKIWRDGPSHNYMYTDSQLNLNEPSYLNENQRHKELLDEIPEFDPDNSKITSRQWLHIIDEVGSKLEGCSGETKKFWFASKLIGSGKGFLNFGNIMQEKWFQIKMQFIKTFHSDLDYHYMIKEMMAINQKENENLLTYFNAKLASIKLCEISGKKAVSLLIGGLHDKSLRTTAFNHNFNSPEELFSFLTQTNKEEMSNHAKVTALETKNDFTCYICNSRSHNSETCESRKQCSRRERDLLSSQDFISKTITVPKYITDVKVNGRYLRGYVDIDGEEVTITEDAANMLRLAYGKPYKSNVRCFGNHFIKTVGELEVLLRIQKVSLEIKVFIVADNDQAFPIVIGKSFILHPNVGMNITDEEAQFYVKDVPSSRALPSKTEFRKEISPGPASKRYRQEESFDRFATSKKKKGYI